MINQIIKNTPFKKRSGNTLVCVYLILKQGDRLCLLLRKNTGYYDGYYGLIAGRVEDGESAVAGMIREAYEEVGLKLIASQIKTIHVTHRKESDQYCIDIFFECISWNGSIENKEPHKCEKLEFFPLNNLPSNMVPYGVDAIKAILKGQFYSEHGWETF